MKLISEKLFLTFFFNIIYFMITEIIKNKIRKKGQSFIRHMLDTAMNIIFFVSFKSHPNLLPAYTIMVLILHMKKMSLREFP